MSEFPELPRTEPFPAPPPPSMTTEATPAAGFVRPDLTAPTTEPAATTLPPPSGEAVIASPAPGRPSRRGVFAVAAVLGLVAAAGVGWLVFGRNRDDTSGPATSEATPVGDEPPSTAVGSRPTGTLPPSNASEHSESGLSISSADTEIDIHETNVNVAAIAQRVAPTVVTVSTDTESDEGTGGSLGTGVIVTSDGNILTNAHVVENATEVRVRLSGETEPVVAEVLAADPENDLALLDIEGTDYPAAVFAQPTSTQLGDPVVAIGFALGLDGEPSVTLGIVSALNRTLDVDATNRLDGLIQTDTAISSGNSGGPLVNAIGEVVGINTAVVRGDVFTAANNVGFAISVEEILQVVPQLRDQANGVVREDGFLGVQLEQRLDGGQGALIESVEDGSPAAAAGLRAGDVVLAVDDATITGANGLVAAIRDLEPGDEVTITFLRDGQEETTSVTLGRRTAS